VYCSLYGPPVVGSALQVPISAYLDDDAWRRVNPVAWQMVKVNETVWAQPRFMMLWPWLGNKDLLSKLGVDPHRLAAEGWDRNEFSRLATEAASPGGPKYARRLTLCAAACYWLALHFWGDHGASDWIHWLGNHGPPYGQEPAQGRLPARRP
jgi:ABC-type glycerol-3-phosphate transport system substrate-binding protein